MFDEAFYKVKWMTGETSAHRSIKAGEVGRLIAEGYDFKRLQFADNTMAELPDTWLEPAGKPKAGV